MLLNYAVGEDCWESLGLQGDPTSQSQRKSVINIHWKDWCWSWNSDTLATWCEELTHLKRPWFWERLKVGGKGDDRGWDGWMASPTRWTWVWVSSGRWWWTGKPGVLQPMGSQRVRHDWVTELNSLSHYSQLKGFSLSFLPPLNSQMNQAMMHPGSKSVKTDRKPAYKKPVVWLVQIPIQADGITTDLASGVSGVQSLVLFFHRFKGC